MKRPDRKDGYSDEAWANAWKEYAEWLETMLVNAKCSDSSCEDGITVMVESGIVSGMTADENGEPVAVQYVEQIPHQVQCEWCWEQKKIVENYGKDK